MEYGTPISFYKAVLPDAFCDAHTSDHTALYVRQTGAGVNSDPTYHKVKKRVYSANVFQAKLLHEKNSTCSTQNISEIYQSEQQVIPRDLDTYDCINRIRHGDTYGSNASPCDLYSVKHV